MKGKKRSPAKIREEVAKYLGTESGRVRLVEALLLEMMLNPEYRAAIAGLLRDDSAVGRVANTKGEPSSEQLGPLADSLEEGLPRLRQTADDWQNNI